MKLNVKRAVSFLVLTLFINAKLIAQKTTRANYEFGLNLGTMIYQGDLAESRLGSLRTQKLFADLHATRLFGNNFSARLNFTIGKLKGDDAEYKNPEYKRHRNFRFSTPVYELSGRLQYDILGRNYNMRGVAPYVFGGIGISFLDISRDWSRFDPDYFPVNADVVTRLPEDIAQELPRSIPVFPVGGGIKYFISPKWALNAELTYRLTTTDYLDGFSKAASPEYRDSYATFGVGIIYRPGKKDPLDCAAFKY